MQQYRQNIHYVVQIHEPVAHANEEHKQRATLLTLVIYSV